MTKEKAYLRFRQEVFSRDKMFCAVCGEDPPLVACRIAGDLPNGGFVAENGISLCHECSKQVEKKRAADLYLLIGSSREQATVSSAKG